MRPALVNKDKIGYLKLELVENSNAQIKAFALMNDLSFKST